MQWLSAFERMRTQVSAWDAIYSCILNDSNEVLLQKRKWGSDLHVNFLYTSEVT